MGALALFPWPWNYGSAPIARGIAYVLSFGKRSRLGPSAPQRQKAWNATGEGEPNVASSYAIAANVDLSSSMRDARFPLAFFYICDADS